MLEYLNHMISLAIAAAILAGYGYIRLDNYEHQVVFTNRDIKHINRLEAYVAFSWLTIITLTIILVGYLIYHYAGTPRYLMLH